MELVIRAKELLSNLEYINLATVGGDGSPWNTPVYAQHNSELIFYWSSWKEAQHSKNIRHNKSIFITLYDSTRQRGDNNRRCLYVRGNAYELENPVEILHACELLYSGEQTGKDSNSYLGDQVRRIYKACPEEIWLNDKSERQVTHETIKMRIEVPLEELIRDLSAS